MNSVQILQQKTQAQLSGRLQMKIGKWEKQDKSLILMLKHTAKVWQCVRQIRGSEKSCKNVIEREIKSMLAWSGKLREA